MAKTKAPLANAVAAKLVTKVKAAFTSEPTPEPQNGRPASEEAIRVGAYMRWDAAGRPGGDGVKYWLEAEQQLSNEK